MKHPSIEALIERWTATATGEPDMLPAWGPFYVVRLPSRWVVVGFRHDEFPGEPGHIDMWGGKTGLAAYLSLQWALHLGQAPHRLFSELENCSYCFPRGRVVQHGTSFRVMHGKDLTPQMAVTHARVEALFGIAGRSKWQFDGHERCLTSDVNEMRELLGVTEPWPAIH